MKPGKTRRDLNKPNTAQRNWIKTKQQIRNNSIELGRQRLTSKLVPKLNELIHFFLFKSHTQTEKCSEIQSKERT